MTSTVPSTTLMAVWSSIAYAGTPSPAAHRSAKAMELPGMPSGATCGQIEKSTIPNVVSSPAGGLHWTKSSPILGVITMLPALSPTQTVSWSDGSRSVNPDCRIQWQRYRASPPATSRTSASWIMGTQRSRSMLGSAVSSSTPTDFQPRSTIGFSDLPLMNCHTLTPGPAMGCPYMAVGMQRALDSAIGLPSRSTSASRMLGFVTPPAVRRSFIVAPDSLTGAMLETDLPVRTHRSGPEVRESSRARSTARGLRIGAHARQRGLVRRQRAGRRVVVHGGAGREVRLRERVRELAGRVPSARDQPHHSRARADWPLPRRGEPGGLPRALGGVRAARRERGATPAGLGLLPRSRVDRARLRGRG